MMVVQKKRVVMNNHNHPIQLLQIKQDRIDQHS